jgi:hypothetical protein
VYKEGEIKKGRNLWLLKWQETSLISEGRDGKYKSGRNKDFGIRTNICILNHPTLPFPVLIKGNVDRIEERNGVMGL